MFRRYYSIPINVHVMDDGTDNIDTINMFGDIVDAEFKYIDLISKKFPCYLSGLW